MWTSTVCRVERRASIDVLKVWVWEEDDGGWEGGADGFEGSDGDCFGGAPREERADEVWDIRDTIWVSISQSCWIRSWRVKGSFGGASVVIVVSAILCLRTELEFFVGGLKCAIDDFEKVGRKWYLGGIVVFDDCSS